MILWKRGVLRRGEFAQYALEQERLHRGWWPFSYRILAELEECYSPADEPLLERLYRSLAAGRIYKITRRGRFTDFDESVVAAAHSAFSDVADLVVHDMGASNAITSLELYRRFSTDRSLRLVASDFYEKMTLVTLPDKTWTVAFDSQSRPIQTTGFGANFGPKPYPWRYVLNRIVQAWVNQSVIPVARHILKNGPAELSQQVSLFHPEAVAQSRSEPRFQLIQHDIFQPNRVPCDIVRALNVITLNHFTREQAQAALRASVHNLREGGWLILGRSVDEEDGRPRATVFRREGGRFLPFWHQHEGYEWPELVAELNVQEPR